MTVLESASRRVSQDDLSGELEVDDTDDIREDDGQILSSPLDTFERLIEDLVERHSGWGFDKLR
ncbi:MAG: hypothetical protein R3A46_00370 [Thermomicrobiales bacterium]